MMNSQEMRTQSGAGVRALCEWAASVTASSVPDAVLARGVRVIADDLAAIVAARGEPEVQRFHARVLARSSFGEATVFCGGRQKTDRFSAAVANAVAADWLELDEGYRKASCHAGLYTVPSLLAHAEATNMGFSDMLRALIVGYEIVTRIARTWPQRELKMQAHGRFAAVGAAATTALARGADAARLHDTLTGAATLVTPSPRNHLVVGALIRNVWPAVGAWSGMMSAEWAECGIGGAEGGFHDVYSTIFGDEAKPEHLTKSLGTEWAVLDGYTKMFACCQHLHSAVEATLDLRGEFAQFGGVEAVKSIVVETHPPAFALANPRPTTTLAAKFSMPHAVAAALVKNTGGAEAFLYDSLADSAIATLRERVTTQPYSPLPAPPNDRPARVRVTLHGGRELVRECLSAQGGPDRPFPPEVLIGKVSTLTAAVYPRLAPTLIELINPARARAAGGWREIVDELCADDAL